MLKQKIDNKQQGNQSVRSNWRDNLHDNAASKFEASSKIAFVENESTQKPVSEWNLELVRSWLTTTSHKIASELSGGDEMEGKLVEFSLKLVEYLQNELNSVRPKWIVFSKKHILYFLIRCMFRMTNK